MAQWAKQKQSGFTIVELLIVVVVIAILAAITVVAYNSIRQRAQSSALQSDMSQSLRQLEAWKTTHAEVYPASLAAAQSENMLINSPEATYSTYLLSPDARNYCATATNANNEAYSISSTAGTPLPGRCVENFITNPSFETNLSGWSTGGAAPTPSRTTGGQSGTYRVQLTKASPVNDAQYNATGPLLADTDYSVAYWAWSNTSNCYAGGQFSKNNGYTPFAGISGEVTTTPTVYRDVGTSPPSTTQYRWRMVPCQDGTSTVYYDGFTAVQASFELKTTYDGDSKGWFWTGTPHASTSIGPAEAL